MQKLFNKCDVFNITLRLLFGPVFNVHLNIISKELNLFLNIFKEIMKTRPQQHRTGTQSQLRNINQIMLSYISIISEKYFYKKTLLDLSLVRVLQMERKLRKKIGFRITHRTPDMVTFIIIIMTLLFGIGDNFRALNLPQNMVLNHIHHQKHQLEL